MIKFSKNIQKLTAVCTAFAAAFSLAACNGGSSAGVDSTNTETETVNVCDQYGMFYTSQTVASSACPYGWRLPTKDEVVAALAAKPGNWWTLGSRFDLESSNKFDESKIDKEGRLWIQTTSDDKNCVQLMNYGGGKDVTTDYLYASAGKRALNVRCVMSE